MAVALKAHRDRIVAVLIFARTAGTDRLGHFARLLRSTNARFITHNSRRSRKPRSHRLLFQFPANGRQIIDNLLQASDGILFRHASATPDSTMRSARTLELVANPRNTG